MNYPPEAWSWFKKQEDGTLRISVNTQVYPFKPLFLTCYISVGMCDLFFEPEGQWV